MSERHPSGCRPTWCACSRPSAPHLEQRPARRFRRPDAPRAAGHPGREGRPGPTSAGVGGLNTTVSVTGFTTTVGSSTTVTLDRPGKVLVHLHGTFSVICGGALCDRTVGVTVGGQTVPGAFATIDGAANASTSRTITASGILTGVAAGTHTVSIASKTSGSANGFSNIGDVRVVAIALGG